ncbi:nicotinamidase-related amidase [Rhodobium orientis]|uniref:Chloramphenicol resistance protein n=1 Tax=Rhodobium orientis TaxID=34017 RepID=A0A327JIJ4_9HYPH|nr:cysteine hydrolase [Rhodobium orientis]MBB4303241.1 nicotinamidase-related amidase [Rhodobium orientis]MBK5951659.1 chloramphenicol resistance protein [Rhodobium orientis]RAI25865.1 chloramphenicol resistance protein [Rhodobium orientis]
MPAKSILLVMDMLNDLVHPDGMGAKSYVPLCQERGVYDATKLAIRRAREAGVMVGYVRVGFSPDYAECPPGSPVFSKARDNNVFTLGGWGTEVFPDFAPEEGDPDIVKHRVSPFYGTKLEPLLRAQGISRLILTGVSTNGVVSAAVREGHDRDYECVLLEDCCAGATREEHDFALAGLKRYATVTSAGDFTI